MFPATFWPAGGLIGAFIFGLILFAAWALFASRIGELVRHAAAGPSGEPHRPPGRARQALHADGARPARRAARSAAGHRALLHLLGLHHHPARRAQPLGDGLQLRDSHHQLARLRRHPGYLPRRRLHQPAHLRLPAPRPASTPVAEPDARHGRRLHHPRPDRARAHLGLLLRGLRLRRHQRRVLDAAWRARRAGVDWHPAIHGVCAGWASPGGRMCWWCSAS